jgi:hypothetical protein
MIMSESAESKDDKLAQACSLCQQALILSQTTNSTNASELVEEIGSSGRGNLFALKCEVQLLLAAVHLKSHKEEEAYTILEEVQKYLINISAEFESPSAISMPAATFVKICSWTGRVLVMRKEIEESITPLSWPLYMFFSSALPDMLSFYEEFLPLLQAITVTKSCSTSRVTPTFCANKSVLRRLRLMLCFGI